MVSGNTSTDKKLIWTTICAFRRKLEKRNFSLTESPRVLDLFRDKYADTETNMEQIEAQVAKEQEQITADGAPAVLKSGWLKPTALPPPPRIPREKADACRTPTSFGSFAKKSSVFLKSQLNLDRPDSTVLMLIYLSFRSSN